MPTRNSQENTISSAQIEEETLYLVNQLWMGCGQGRLTGDNDSDYWIEGKGAVFTSDPHLTHHEENSVQVSP